jgi:hypothetical protein
VTHKSRPFLATSRISRGEDNGLLDSPLRKLDEICGRYSVRTFIAAKLEIAVEELTIRYMNETAVVETGTHDELMKSGGDYARLWKLQADAFT